MEIREIWNQLGERLGLIEADGAAEIVKLAATDGEFEVEAARSGNFRAMNGEKVEITPALLSELAETFDPKVFRPVQKLGHPDPGKTNEPSYGPITGLRYDPKSDRLLAKVDPNADLRQFIKDKKFTERSIEYAPDWRGTGKARLLGLGWLGATPPAIDSLAALAGGLDTGGSVFVMALGKEAAADDDATEIYYFRDFTSEERKKAASEGAALKDGSFPIYNQDDLDNAAGLAGNAKNPAAAKAHIRKRAKALGLKLPDSYKQKAAADTGDDDEEDEMADEAAVKLAEAKATKDRADAQLQKIAEERADVFFEKHKDRIPMSAHKAGARALFVRLCAKGSDEKAIKLAGSGTDGKETLASDFEAFCAILAELPPIIAQHEKDEAAKKEKAAGDEKQLSDRTKAADIVSRYENVVQFSKSDFHAEVLAAQDRDPKLTYTEAYEIVAEERARRERTKK
jgi:hypothetical protein